jgi:hypothetical protein
MVFAAMWNSVAPCMILLKLWFLGGNKTQENPPIPRLVLLIKTVKSCVDLGVGRGSQYKI